MIFRIELRDTNFNIKEILDREVSNLSWSYSRIGGCGGFDFLLPRRRFAERALRGDFNVRIYYRNPDTDVFDLWYQGLVNQKSPTITGYAENIPVSGHGYQNQLDRVYLNNVTYTSQEASAIITDLLDTQIVPNTNIAYSAGDIENTGFTIDSINFNESVRSAIEKIANIVGTREWGVDANRNFYFKARATSISFRFLHGQNITNFQDSQDFSNVVNRIIFQGAQSGGTYFTSGPYNNLPSQNKYNLRTVILQNSSVVTSDVADQLADAYLSEFSEVSRRATCSLINFNALLEATTPIGLLAEISKKVKYGQKKYGTFLYSGIVGRIINRINYSLSNNGSLKINLELGQVRPKLSEEISQLKFQIEQQRSAAL